MRAIDLDLYAGEFMVVLGPSGSGKSTLLSVLGGLDRATAGSISFRDDELTPFDDRALTAYRRRHIGFVFQSYNLIASLTVRENVELVADVADRSLAPTRALELVGLAHRMDDFPAQLSGGEQQRVAIARALAKRPDVLLCDEPTGAVDCKTGVLVLEAIERCNLEFGSLDLAGDPQHGDCRHGRSRAHPRGRRRYGRAHEHASSQGGRAFLVVGPCKSSTGKRCAICGGFAARQQ